MTDFVTACAAADEQTTIDTLTKPGGNFGHTYVQTFRGLTHGDLLLLVTNEIGQPGQVSQMMGGSVKVLIHTVRS